MRAEKHEGNGLKYLTILPDDYDPEANYPMVIMLHGFGANMEDLAGLAPAINKTGYVYACPNAPLSYNLGGGHIGFGWTPRRDQAAPADIRTAENLLGSFFDEVLGEFRVSPGQALLIGFSQGGGMTYRCGLGRANVFAGLAALSATMPNPRELEKQLPESREQPIFVAHGLSDPLVPLESAHGAKSFLEGAGYHPEYHEYNMAHEISNDVLNDLIPWIAKVLPPFSKN